MAEDASSVFEIGLGSVWHHTERVHVPFHTRLRLGPASRLQTQEEVTRLQQRLLEVQKAGETVATRLTTDALQGSARLQEQNEQLRQELESMEVGVRVKCEETVRGVREAWERC